MRRVQGRGARWSDGVIGVRIEDEEQDEARRGRLLQFHKIVVVYVAPRSVEQTSCRFFVRSERRCRSATVSRWKRLLRFNFGVLPPITELIPRGRGRPGGASVNGVKREEGPSDCCQCH
jgi:hypothetical protein